MVEGQKRIAVLASGSGTTFEAYVNAALKNPAIPQVGLVICNKPGAGIFEKVERFNLNYPEQLHIKSRLINSELFPKGDLGRGQTAEESEEICNEISRQKIGFVALMGYMKIIPGNSALMKNYGWFPDYQAEYPETKGIYLSSMLNTHPGILPETTNTYGIHTQEKILELELKKTAHTVHAVSPDVDEGPIFAKHFVDVLPDDTPQILFDRVQVTEKAYLPKDIARFIRNQAKFLGEDL